MHSNYVGKEAGQLVSCKIIGIYFFISDFRLEVIFMSKRVYISADYSEDDGDREVVETLKKWGNDSLHKVDFTDMAEVKSGSVSDSDDCRPCMLKEEFNQQINLSSAVIFVVGDKTAMRMAGSNCERPEKEWYECACASYKQNFKGRKRCNVYNVYPAVGDVGNINKYSYLKHEFEQAKIKSKNIIIFYNSLRNESQWLPSYMIEYVQQAQPFWLRDSEGKKVGNYSYLKKALGYD